MELDDSKPKRQNTRLESEGAEFLVLANLLIEGIESYKTYINYPGYDLVAINPETKKSAKIQVKSRWATDYDFSFPIKNFDCDFVVHVALNRGIRFNKNKSNHSTTPESPTIYVFPLEIVKSVRKDAGWGKVYIKKISNYKSYINKWSLIKESLK